MNKGKQILLIIFSFLCIFINAKNVSAATNQWNTITPSGTSGYIFNTMAGIGNNVYLGTDHGIYKSTDGGTTWTQTNTGLSTHLNITSIAIGWYYNSTTFKYATTSNTYVFVGTSDGGVFASTISGSNWTATSTGLTDTNILDIEIDQAQATQGSYTDIYVATPSGIFISTTTGASWQLDNTGIAGQSTRVVSGFGSQKIYSLSSNNRIYSSNIHSASHVYESWSSIFNGSGTTTNDVSILNATGNILWISTSKGIYKSNDANTSFASTSIGLPNSSIGNVASDYNDSNIAYASINGYGVYRTTNEAIANYDPQIPEWLPINLNLTDLNIKEVKTDPYDSTVVYAISSNGVYKLQYGNIVIENFDGVPPSAVSDLSVTNIAGVPRLSWTAPGSNGTFGTSTSYDIRYSTSPITEENFHSATPVIPQPSPNVSGYPETYLANNLPTGVTLYFALKAIDNFDNTSNLSNVVSFVRTSPTVSTQVASTISQTGATLNGTIVTNSNVASTTDRGFAYGVSVPYSATTTESGDFSTGAFTSVLSAVLTCNTTYHYSAYATNAFGTGYGSDSSFTTSACSDNTAPIITAFTIPATSESLTVSITSFTATDNTSVTGYLIRESSTAPQSNDSDWSVNAQSTYVFSSAGSKTLYAWAKDSAGNVSLSSSAQVIITLNSGGGSSGGGSGGGGGGNIIGGRLTQKGAQLFDTPIMGTQFSTIVSAVKNTFLVVDWSAKKASAYGYKNEKLNPLGQIEDVQAVGFYDLNSALIYLSKNSNPDVAVQLSENEMIETPYELHPQHKVDIEAAASRTPVQFLLNTKGDYFVYNDISIRTRSEHYNFPYTPIARTSSKLYFHDNKSIYVAELATSVKNQVLFTDPILSSTTGIDISASEKFALIASSNGLDLYSVKPFQKIKTVIEGKPIFSPIFLDDNNIGFWQKHPTNGYIFSTQGV
jgi:ligand-binding sensor domain-containing protein